MAMFYNNNLCVLSRLLNNYKCIYSSIIIPSRCVNIPSYKGPFDQKKVIWKRPASRERINKLFDDVNQIRASEIKDPAPLHLVWRMGTMAGTKWQEKVILRRLALHDQTGRVRRRICQLLVDQHGELQHATEPAGPRHLPLMRLAR